MNSSFKLSIITVQKNIFFRRLIYSFVILAVFVISDNLLIAQQSNIITKDSRSANVVAEASKSLGGEKVESIKSLILTGNEKRSVFTPADPTNLMDLSSMKKTGEQLLKFEIKVLFPDNLIMITQDQKGNNIGYLSNHSGNPLEINILRGILLGMIMKTDDMPLTISVNSNNEFTLEKNDGLYGTINFDTKNKWPSNIEHRYVGQVPVMTTLPDGKTRLDIKPGNEEHVSIQFSERFTVDGVMFPKIIRSLIEGQRDRTLEVTNVMINPPLTQKDFEISTVE